MFNAGQHPLMTASLDVGATDSGGRPVIPADVHIRLARFEHNGGTRILRRGDSFADGIDRWARPGQGMAGESTSGWVYVKSGNGLPREMRS